MHPVDVVVKVGRRIRYLRSVRGVHQADLAELAGISRISLSHLENGRAEGGIRTLHRIALALGVKLAELFVTVELAWLFSYLDQRK